MTQIDLDQLIARVGAAAMKEQDLIIGDRENYVAHFFQHFKLLGVVEFLRLLKARGAELRVSPELAREWGFGEGGEGDKLAT